jgi:hypothetical protein
MLLPGAFYDAERNEIVDARLGWVVLDLSDFYLSQGRKVMAKELLQSLAMLQGQFPSAEHIGDYWFEGTALRQLIEKDARNQSESLYRSFIEKAALIARVLRPASGRTAIASS